MLVKRVCGHDTWNPNIISFIDNQPSNPSSTPAKRIIIQMTLEGPLTITEHQFSCEIDYMCFILISFSWKRVKYFMNTPCIVYCSIAQHSSFPQWNTVYRHPSIYTSSHGTLCLSNILGRACNISERQRLNANGVNKAGKIWTRKYQQLMSSQWMPWQWRDHIKDFISVAQTIVMIFHLALSNHTIQMEKVVSKFEKTEKAVVIYEWMCILHFN